MKQQYQDSLTQHANSLNTQKTYQRRALPYAWQYYTNNGEIALWVKLSQAGHKTKDNQKKNNKKEKQNT